MWACVVAIAMARQRSLAWDDPYILFRYAENLVNGHGWTFNMSQHTANAVTSPAMVLLLSALREVRVPMLPAAAAIHFCAMVTAAHLTWRALRSSGAILGAHLAAVAVASSPAFTLMWGMESSLYIALLALIVNLGLKEHRWWVLGIPVGLIGLVRPDAMLAGGMSLLVVVSTRGARPRGIRDLASLGAPIVAPGITWMTIQSMMVGPVIPSTLAAKRAQTNSGLWTSFGAWDSFAGRRPWNLRGQLVPSTSGGMVMLWTGIALVVIGLIAITLRSRGAAVAMALGLPALLMVMLYGWILKVPSYPWYWSVPAYALIVCAAVGFDLVVRRIPGSRRMLLILTAVVMAITAWAQVAGTTDQRTSFRKDYDAIGGWLKTETPHDATVAAFEIGRISWTSDRTIIDPLGLLDSELSRFVNRGDFTSWLSASQPDYWVVSFGLIDAPLRQSPCLSRHFVEVFRTEFFSVFERTSAIPRSDSCAADSL